MSIVRPEIKVDIEASIFTGFTSIVQELKRKDDSEGFVIGIDCYPTFNEELIKLEIVDKISNDYVLDTSDIFFNSRKVNEKIKDNLTEDRIYGVMSTYNFSDFIEKKIFEKEKQKIKRLRDYGKIIIIYGVGAALFENLDLLVYADLTRWEIQKPYRSGDYSNWKADNKDEDPLRMVKRGYFFEWRAADRHKRKIISRINYFLDLHDENLPKLIDSHSYYLSLQEISRKPFSLVPFFASGIWGGNWLQSTYNIRKEEDNLAWSFNCIPEENSLLISYKNGIIESPASNLVFLYPEELLGKKVYGRFGTDFPIRFNILDTMGGQNLSLQVHPKVDYIQNVFGAHYTQDESYYVLDVSEDAVVYLGVNEGINKEELMKALEDASDGSEIFDDKKFIFRSKIKKHDHYLIPSGTIHSSGKNSVILEISATPNRFTMKLWDWNRVDMDGKPRPVHLTHGEANIDIYKDENWVKKELINQFKVKHIEDGWKEEVTGLHESEFIETRRHTFNKSITIKNHDSVNVICLVEGNQAIIKSPDNSFEPFICEYTQAVIIPANITNYKIEPLEKNDENQIIIQAFVR